MQPIPRPQVLDPDRSLTDQRDPIGHATRSATESLTAALRESCEYGQKLWQDLDVVRHYLMDSLPPDPGAPGGIDSIGAAPTGPDDEAGWDAWIAAFAATTSALAGPQGDSGYGLAEARRAADRRRSAPVVRLHADHPRLGTNATPANPPREPADKPVGRALRMVGMGTLIALALRGLRPGWHR